MKLKANLVSSHSPEVAYCAAISPSIIPVTQCSGALIVLSSNYVALEMVPSLFIVPKKVEINYYIFIDTYKSNKIIIGMNEMRVKDNEIMKQ